MANPAANRELVARWESKSGKHWVEVYDSPQGQSYSASGGAGGWFYDGPEAMMARMTNRVAMGDFQPDSAKTPMALVYHKNVPADFSGSSIDTTAQRLNPHYPGVGTDDDASAMYEEFHGKPSSERITVTDSSTYEDALSVLGELIEIKVHCADGKRDYVLGFRKDGVLLASNPTGTQLYLVGGNQSLPLDTMGITGAQASKTSVVIGEAFEITYRTKKGFDKFRETEYFHELGEETGHKPVLIYNTLNCEMELAGGAYETKPEGITN